MGMSMDVANTCCDKKVNKMTISFLIDAMKLRLSKMESLGNYVAGGPSVGGDHRSSVPFTPRSIWNGRSSIHTCQNCRASIVTYYFEGGCQKHDSDGPLQNT